MNPKMNIPTRDRSRVAERLLHRKRGLDRLDAALLGLLLLLAAGSTQAALVMQTKNFDFSLAPTAIPESTTTFTGVVASPGSFTGTFSPFDSALGTLTSFDVVWDLFFSAEWQNLSSGYVNFDFGYNPSLPLLKFAGATYNASSHNASIVISPANDHLDFSRDISNSFNLAFPLSINPVILAAVTGSSDFDIAFEGGSKVSMPSVSSVAPGGSVSATATGTLTLTYNYEPVPSVPLPPTALLLLPGLGLLGFGARRQASPGLRRSGFRSNPRMRRCMTPLLFGAALLGLGSTLGITKADAAIVLLDNTSGLTDTAYNNSNQTAWGSNTPAYNRINGRVFTTGATAWLLDSVSLLLRDASQPDGMTWQVSLWALGASDTAPAGGATPTYQESFSGIDLTGFSGYTTLSPTADWLMAANSRYAIGFANDIGTASTGWGSTATSGTPSSTVGFTYDNGFFSTSGGSAFSVAGPSVYTFQLTGSEPTPAPAPPTLALLALGALVAGVTRRWHRRAAAR